MQLVVTLDADAFTVDSDVKFEAMLVWGPIKPGLLSARRATNSSTQAQQYCKLKPECNM